VGYDMQASQSSQSSKASQDLHVELIWMLREANPGEEGAKTGEEGRSQARTKRSPAREVTGGRELLLRVYAGAAPSWHITAQKALGGAGRCWGARRPPA
jgi:hypothetical protein